VRSPSSSWKAAAFLDSLVTHYVLDGGRLVAAHAGLKEEMQGRSTGRVREFALYGETTGEMDELGLPVRLDWAARYHGTALVVYGHTPVAEPRWLNRTINIDTGCVFGGALTALRYPELELVSVPARAVYAASPRDFLVSSASRPAAEQEPGRKRLVETRLRGAVILREESAAAAEEALSRLNVDPKWLIYLPPTMSPPDASRRPGLLEHPAEAFSYYRHEGVDRVICEEQHTGTRAVVVICRDEGEVRRRFGTSGKELGVCFGRAGRRLFDSPALEKAFLTRLRDAIEDAGLWDRLQTSWLCLDCELMPWSFASQELIRERYASVGAAARVALPKAVARLAETGARGLNVTPLLTRYRERYTLAERFSDAYRRYCWPVTSLADLRLAPFHLLASEGAVHVDKDHAWHLETLAAICQSDPSLLLATAHHFVDLADPTSEEAATAWWENLTAKGGEGMVVKPQTFIARGRRGLTQPALKCRGPEFLRIIYGPEYALLENLERFRERGLNRKRSLALREFALGVEGLERFVRGEPLRRVHECVFGVLALESEVVDPRL
jgi:protein phosphatase